ncbi:hypothetical protein EDD86DRAFT_201051 [Gorgonomyces haynaldii]|nr:hypothetical protein EDD86DRAFT_201051 [Gorgonomyces haynaldii]
MADPKDRLPKTHTNALAQTITSWYQPVYRDPKLTPEERALKPRYCGGRMNKAEFVFVHLLILANILAVILLPISYFSIIPSFIQHKINHVGFDQPFQLNGIHIGSLQKETLNVGVDLELGSLFPLPIKAGVGSMQIHVLSRDIDEIVVVDLPDLEFWLNAPIRLDLDLKIGLSQDNQQRMQQLLREFSQQGLKDYKIVAHFKAPIRVFGLTIYSGLDLYKEISLAHLEPNLASLKDLIPAGFVSKPTGAALRSKFKASDILDLTGSFSIVWSQLKVNVNDQGLGVVFGVSFENPVPITLSEITGIELYLAVENTKILQIVIDAVRLDNGLQDWLLDIHLNFVAPSIDIQKVPDAITRASKNYVASGGFAFGLVGPIKIKGADFVQTITRDIAIDFSVKQMLDILFSSNGHILDTLLSKDTIQSILEHSSISLSVKDDIQSDLSLVVPVFAAIPRQFDFAYTTAVGVYGDKKHALQVNVKPLHLTRSDDFIRLESGITLKPVNTLEAAQGLATAINPVLSVQPQRSSVGIKDLLFSESGRAFQWTLDLFRDKIIDIGLPQIDKAMILKSLGPLTQLVTIESMQVEQLQDRPGFGAKGSISHLPFPQILVDVGYLEVDATVESTILTSIDMNSGFRLNQQPQTQIDALLTLGTEIEVQDKVAKVAHAFLYQETEPSYCGITAFTFGPSAASKIITFSKIIIDFDTPTLLNLVGPLSFDGSFSLQGADLDIQSGTVVSLNAQGSLVNPLQNIAIQLGTVLVDATLDDRTLASVSVNPFNIKTGNMNLNMNVHLSSGSNAMDQKVSQLVNQIQQGQFSRSQLEATNLVLQSQSKIDQFRKIRIPLSKTAFVDLNPILPSQDILNQLDPSLGFLQLAISQDNNIKTGADVKYKNPVPVSAKIPFAHTTVSVDDLDILQVDLTGLSLQRLEGMMQPRLLVSFSQDSEQAVARLFDGFLNGTLDQTLRIKNIVFGSLEDKNDLLRLVDLDVTKIARPLWINGPILKESIDRTIENILTGKLGSQDAKIFSVGLPFGVLDVNTANATFLPGSVIGAQVGVFLGLSIPVEIDIPFLTLDTQIDALGFVKLQLDRFSAHGTKIPMNLNMHLIFNDVPELQDSIQEITTRFVKRQDLKSVFRAGGIRLGSSDKNVIDALSGTFYGISIDRIMHSLDGSPGFDIHLVKQLIQTFGFQVNSLDVEPLVGHALRTQLQVGFSKLLPVQVSNLGFIGFGTAIDTIKILDITLQGLKLDTRMDFAPLLVFPSAVEIQDKVSSFILNLQSNFGKTTEYLALAGVKFGYSQDDYIRVFSKAYLPVLSSKLINQETLEYLKPISSVDLQLNDVDAQFHPSAVIDAQVGANLSMPFKIKLNMPHVHLDSFLNSIRFCRVDVSGFKTVDLNQTLALKTSLLIDDSGALSQAVAEIVQDVLHDKIQGRLGLGDLSFGLDSNPDNLIDTFAKTRVLLDLSQVYNRFKFDFQLNLNTTHVNVKSLEALKAQTIVAGVDVSFSNQFSLTVRDLGFIRAQTLLDQAQFVTFTGAGVELEPGQNNLSLSTQFKFQSSQEIQENVKKFVQEVVKNGLGQTSAIFGLTGIRFGYDADNAFRFLDRALLELESRLFDQKALDQLLKILQISINDLLALSSAKVQLNPSNVIDCGLKARVNLTTSMDIPFVSLKTQLDSIPFADLGISNLTLKEKQVDLKTQVAIHDSGQLSDKVGVLVNEIINNKTDLKLTIDDVYFGVGEQDAIDTFARIHLDLPIQRFTSLLSLNLTEITNGLAISDVNANTLPKRTMEASLKLKYKNPFDLDLNLGFVYADFGISDSVLTQFKGSGISLQPGTQTMDIRSSLYFPSDPVLQQSVKVFVDALLNDRPTQQVFLNKISFGYDEQHQFRFLQRAFLSLQVPQKELKAYIQSLDLQQILDGLTVPKAHVAFSDESLDLESTVQLNTTLPHLAVGYASLGAYLDSERAIQVETSLNLSQLLDLQTKVNFMDSPQLEDNISLLAKQFLSNQTTNLVVGGGGLAFGADSNPNNQIDSFQLVLIPIPPLPIVRKWVYTQLNRFSLPPWHCTGLSLDASNYTMQIEASVTLDIKGDYQLSMPFAQSSLWWDGFDFALARLKNVQFLDQTLSLSLDLDIQHPNDTISKQIIELGSNVVFHRKRNYTNIGSLFNVGFGTSQKIVKLFSKVEMTGGLNDYIQVAFDYFDAQRPMELVDMQTKVIQGGVLMPTTIKSIPFPIEIRGSVSALVTWMPTDGSRELLIVEALFSDFRLQNTENPTIMIQLKPSDDTGLAISDSLTNLLTFEDLTYRAYLGSVVVYPKDSKQLPFVGLKPGKFHAPELVLWNPITIDVVPNWQIFGNGRLKLPISVLLAFLNPGPFHLDIGSVLVQILDRNKSVLDIASKGDFVIINGLEGGNLTSAAGPPTQANFEIIIPLSDANPLFLLQLLKDLITKHLQFELKIRIQRDGQDIEWVERVIQQIRPEDLKKLIPLLAAIISHFRIEIFGLDITQSQIYQELVKLVIAIVQSTTKSSLVPNAQDKPLIIRGF